MVIQTWPRHFFWQYKTSPVHLFDYSVRFFLRPIMLLKADGKISHWWHWKKISKPKNWKGILVKGDEKNFERTGLFSSIKMSLGGWKKVYVLMPKNNVENWYYAYELDERTIARCSISLQGPIRILQGSHDYTAFRLDEKNNEIPLEIIGSKKRSDQSVPWPII